MSGSMPPMYRDTPLTLVPTPKFETGKDDPFTTEASHMALSHNSFIRGFNSIYQQAPRVRQPLDKADFVDYCLAWVDCVAAHHKYEEADFFPSLDRAAGQSGLMDGAIHEHAAFHGGMARFRDYLVDKGPTGFSGTELVAIMDEFKDALHRHLAAEPAAIAALARYSTPDRPIDILGITTVTGKKQLSVGFVFNTVPVFFLNMETVEFEGGMWHGVFPPVKGLAKTVMTKAVPLWHSGRWRFVSCSADGRVKRLEV
ncbi:iron-sulfur cluster repair protein DnrN [Chaetomidium leptoderma]|uniref:Iron-sulfur cluster repair protein DnrN n=1 Tax=Chaetomidium leptoderma TaxID=669021 RepID=A0AAN6VCM4_9PEZI|nr:iron-sulfur cluster repair protein DnrN [Chaetomidium leptoderma]